MSFLEFETASNNLFERYKPLYANSENRKELYLKYCDEFHTLRDLMLSNDALTKTEIAQIDRYSDKLNNRALKLTQK